MRILWFSISIVLSLALAFNLSSCARKAIPKPSKTLEESISVTRNSKGDYTLKFTDQDKWSIYAGDSPIKINWKKALVKVTGEEITLTQFEKSKRVYFGVKDKNGSAYIVSERKLALEGAPNFRDIGGLEAKDGRIVTWGKIFRSSNLAELESEDLKYLNNLNIKAVCDFRYDSEIKKDPNRLPDGVNYYLYPIGGKEGHFYEKLKRQVRKEGLRKKAAKKEFVNVMRMFADSAAHDFKPVMDKIIDPEMKEIPLVYHCSGGKDRTGYMSMVILAALGVEKETIRNEYLMSNYYRYKKNKSIARKVGLLIDSETLQYILVVQNEYFDAVFDVIENKYGGIENYLLEKYDITPEIHQQMIENYTIDPSDLASQAKKNYGGKSDSKK